MRAALTVRTLTQPKVLYIAGCGRSGTTILDNVLGQIDGFLSTGEVHFLWKRGLKDGRLCGCGLPVPECETWRRIIRTGFGRLSPVCLDEILEQQASEMRTRNVVRLWLDARRGKSPRYAKPLATLYHGIQTATGSRVIIDSSKYPADAIAALTLDDIDVYVLHVLRDPRAVAFSWSRRRLSPGKQHGDGMLRRIGWFRSTVAWVSLNLLIDSTVRHCSPRCHFLRIRYEEFASDPSGTVDRIVRFLGEPDCADLFDGRSTVLLGESHTASGNPSRFKTGRVAITRDDEWLIAMPAHHRIAISFLSAPFLSYFGYKFRSHRTRIPLSV